MLLVQDTAKSPFCKSQRKEVNSDWLADQWDERSVLGHAQFHKGKVKENDPEVATEHNPKIVEGVLDLLEKIRTTFTDSIMNNYEF